MNRVDTSSLLYLMNHLGFIKHVYYAGDSFVAMRLAMGITLGGVSYRNLGSSLLKYFCGVGKPRKLN